MTNKKKRSFSINPMLGFSLLLAIGFGGIAIRGAVESRGADGAFGQLATVTIWLLVFLGALFGLVGGFSQRSKKRAETLQGSVSGVTAFSTVRTSSLGKATRSLAKVQPVKFSGLPEPLPWTMACTFDASGLQLWSGFTQPKKFIAIEWRDISSIVAERIDEYGVSQRGIAVQLRMSPATPLALAVKGAGFAGGSSKDWELITSYVESMEEFRREAGQSQSTLADKIEKPAREQEAD